MAERAVEFLVVGGGVAGLSTAWHLARAGAGESTLLLEAGEHLAAESSAQNAAILRTLSSDPISTEIGLRSARFLRTPPEGFSESPLVDAFGLLLVGAEERLADLADWVSAIDALEESCKVERLMPPGVRSLAPHFQAEVAGGFWFPEEGRIDIGALVGGFVRGARSGGATLRRQAKVAELLQSGGRVCGVRLVSGEEIRAETTILAAGGWAAPLGASAGSTVSLRPTRRHLMITAPDVAIDRRWPVIWYFGPATEGEFYCRPEAGGMLLCACEINDVDPDRFDVEDRVRRAIAEKGARHLPALQRARAAHFWCGMRTLTADGRFALGPDPELGGLFWVAGLGGSGMVCSAEVGRLSASRLLGISVDERTEKILDALHPRRLAL